MNNEHPILFSTPMVKAILDGRKTQTRRILKFPQPLDILPMVKPDKDGFVALMTRNPNHGQIIKCRYSNVGDKLWVRESWASQHKYDHLPPRLIPHDANIHFATSEQLGGLMHRPSIFLPRWASRLTLEITEIRVQRLQEITQQDAIQEGVLFMGGMADNWDDAPWCASLKDQEPMKYPSAAYGRLWDTINGKTHPWESNPWVWAISFKVLDSAVKEVK